MRKLSLMVAAVAVCIAFAGCKKDESKSGGGGSSASHEQIAKDMIAKMKELAGILKSVKDEASAKSAATKIKAMEADFEQFGKRIKAAGKPTTQEEKRLDEKYEKEMQATGMAIGQELQRIQKDPRLKAAADAMEALSKKMEAIDVK